MAHCMPCRVVLGLASLYLVPGSARPSLTVSRAGYCNVGVNPVVERLDDTSDTLRIPRPRLTRRPSLSRGWAGVCSGVCSGVGSGI